MSIPTNPAANAAGLVPIERDLLAALIDRAVHVPGTDDALQALVSGDPSSACRFDCPVCWATALLEGDPLREEL